MNNKVTENDNHKTPIIFEGEMTPEIIKKKETAEKALLKEKSILKRYIMTN